MIVYNNTILLNYLYNVYSNNDIHHTMHIAHRLHYNTINVDRNVLNYISILLFITKL